MVRKQTCSKPKLPKTCIFISHCSSYFCHNYYKSWNFINIFVYYNFTTYFWIGIFGEIYRPRGESRSRFMTVGDKVLPVLMMNSDYSLLRNSLQNLQQLLKVVSHQTYKNELVKLAHVQEESYFVLLLLLLTSHGYITFETRMTDNLPTLFDVIQMRKI